MTALALVTILGFAGLAVDMGHGYALRRGSQQAADSAAFSAAAALTAGGADPTADARAVAARYGLAASQVQVNLPPASGPNAGDTSAVEVVVERPRARFFSGFVGGQPGLVRARAVARAGKSGDACVVALNATASAAAAETGTADVVLNGCSLFANSSSQSALELKGGARLTAQSVGLVGSYSQSSNSSITTVESVRTGQAPINDPYRGVSVPPYSGCDALQSGSTTYAPRADGSPRVFCNGLQLNAGETITLQPGVYILKGDLKVGGGATLQGDGVTIILTSDSASYPSVNISGDANINLSAPVTGPTAGLVFFQDRAAPYGEGNQINGGANFRIQGALYFPSQKLTFTGGAGGAGACTQILANTVQFSGNARLSLDCAGKGVSMIGGRRPSLIE